MAEVTASPFLVPFDGSFDPANRPTTAPGVVPTKAECKSRLKQLNKELSRLQRLLYASNRHSLLLIFQAIDAAGKDSTIRTVLTGVNPAGCQVYSFKQPSAEELDHDFLWRTACRLPERGRIGVFNRSYYEEVLVVRVHPEYLEGQRLPPHDSLEALWESRFESIRSHERHLAENGTIVLKFWLNLSREEQRRRLIRRIDRPDKNWKFSASDLEERAHWDTYVDAYGEALRATSRPYAPWYAIPADDKPHMRVVVADIVVRTLGALQMRYPILSDDEQAQLVRLRRQLEVEV